MRELGMSYPVVMGNPKIVGDYGFITKIPTTFVIDFSELSEAEMERIVDLLRRADRLTGRAGGGGAALWNKRAPYLLLTYMPTRHLPPSVVQARRRPDIKPDTNKVNP